MLALKANSKLVLNEDIMLRSIPEADQYYAFNLKNGDHYSLNETAYWVLEAIGQGGEYNKLIKIFSKEFRLNHKNATKDLSEVVVFAIKNSIVNEVSNGKESSLSKT